MPIPTVKAAADVAACPTKGRAGSTIVASCLPRRLLTSTQVTAGIVIYISVVYSIEAILRANDQAFLFT